jgi:predicted O-methyltransferase YrrM
MDIFRTRTKCAPTDLVASIPQADIHDDLPEAGLRHVAEAIHRATSIDLREESLLLPLEEDRLWFQRWPGEHYRFLRALVMVTKPKLILDVGTYHGASALALAVEGSRVVTYDIVSLNEIGNGYTGLVEGNSDIEQRIGNLAESEFFLSQATEISEADLILVDGPKDGKFEYEAVPNILNEMHPGSLLVLDDIRFANMQELWKSIPFPRIDVGCFAHSTGTGVVFR